MATQTRAQLTRRKIMESAVDLFFERGYGDVGLVDIVEGAGLTKGAFYYHFKSKEEVAAAIVADYGAALAETVDAHFDAAAPTVADMITATFAMQSVMWTDKRMAVGQRLLQALDQISSASRDFTRAWTDRFVGMVLLLHDAGQVRRETDPVEVAEAIWAAVLGTHIVSSAAGDDALQRLARCWRMLARSMAPADIRYDEVIDETVARMTASADGPAPS